MSRKGINLGEKNPMWVGNRVRYTPLHNWIKRHKPESKSCEDCHKEYERLDLANISGKYRRDINDFKWLCRKCHMEEDGRLNKLKIRNFNMKGKGKNNPNWKGGISLDKNQYNKDYYAKHMKGWHRKYRKEYYLKNQDKIKARNKKEYSRKREEINKRHKKYYEKNKERILKRQMQNYLKNKDKINKKRRERYYDNKNK